MSGPLNRPRPAHAPVVAALRLVLFAVAFSVGAILLIGSAVWGGGIEASSALQGASTSTPTLIPGSGAIVGLVWLDTDADKAQDAGEAPLPNATIQAENKDTGAKFSALSGADGRYRLNLSPGVYRVTILLPPGYALTTESSYDVAMASGALVTLNFGAWLPPTVTPTPTSPPLLDPSGAERIYCGGVYSGDTRAGNSNVATYSCVPWWDESGPEKVYRLELVAAQPVTVTLLTSAPDHDLFLLRYIYPDSCLSAGDTHFTHTTEPGVYFLSVDGYRGASGPYTFRIDCPTDERATVTPTPTPSRTPTATSTAPATSTPTATVWPAAAHSYLPMIWRTLEPEFGPTITLTLQDGLNGYAGTTDTSLDSWTPTTPAGSDNRLRLFYARTQAKSQKMPVVRFDLSFIPVEAEVRSAKLRLYLPAAPAYDVRVAAHALLRAWDETTATWNEAAAGLPWAEPGASAVGVDRSEWTSGVQHLIEGAAWYEFDVTPLAKTWASQPGSNYGMVLTALAGDSNASVEARFTSREGNANFRPQFMISYALPTAAN